MCYVYSSVIMEREPAANVPVRVRRRIVDIERERSSNDRGVVHTRTDVQAVFSKRVLLRRLVRPYNHF